MSLEPVSRVCQHQWELVLDPDTPNLVLVHCTMCPALLDDIWAGATDSIYMQMGDFTVADGQHTATRSIKMPIDVRIKESMAYSPQLGLSSTFEVFVTPKTIGIEASESSSPGWCAPSP